MKKHELWIVLGTLLLAVLLLWITLGKGPKPRSKNPLTYEVERQWKLPEPLAEISGIAWLEGDRLAAIQDEFGQVVIFGLEEGRVLDQFSFADAGDFEAIAARGEDLYILRSDGTIFVVQDYGSPQRTVTTFETPFTFENNMESIAWEPNKDRLLVAPKDKDLKQGNTKGIYVFSLAQGQLLPNPVFEINLSDETFIDTYQPDLNKVFRPSDMTVHPQTGEIYILDGVIPQLLILNSSGIIKDVYSFNPEFFPQPEGIAFSPEGTLFISNEGEKDLPATITQLVLKE
jgi:uncharacterized protein YjiK